MLAALVLASGDLDRAQTVYHSLQTQRTSDPAVAATTLGCIALRKHDEVKAIFEWKHAFDLGVRARCSAINTQPLPRVQSKETNRVLWLSPLTVYGLATHLGKTTSTERNLSRVDRQYKPTRESSHSYDAPLSQREPNHCPDKRRSKQTGASQPERPDPSGLYLMTRDQAFEVAAILSCATEAGFVVQAAASA